MTVKQILIWADTHKARTGGWPTSRSGPVTAASGETWWNINEALLHGYRGLPGGDSLARLLARRRARPNLRALPALTEQDILRWAVAHHRRTGHWPNAASGPVQGLPGTTWCAINLALHHGHRGMPGGDSLSRLLARRLGDKHQGSRRPLAVTHVLRWARAHRHRTGEWPRTNSGPVLDAPGENWSAINMALWAGNRGLPGGSSLAQLLRGTGARGRGRAG